MKKCPWDRKQTFESLITNTVEETYELVDALSGGDMQEIKKELGDLLFAMVNAARLYGLSPEAALEATNRKFLERFDHIEQTA